MSIDGKLLHFDNELKYVTDNIYRLDDNEQIIYNDYMIINNILHVLKNVNNHKFDFVLDYFLIKKIRISIDKMVDNKDKLHDLFIIDNLHDFLDNRAKGDKNLSFYIEITLLNLLNNDELKKYLLLKDNNVNNARYEIFKMYKFDNFINIANADDNNLPIFNINKNDIYFETNGIFSVNNMICPYKNSLDQAKCNNDTIEIRNNLILIDNITKFNNYILNMQNYDDNIINIHFVDNDVKLNIINQNNQLYYTYYMSEPIQNYIKQRKINEHVNKTIEINGVHKLINNTVTNIFAKMKQVKKQILNNNEQLNMDIFKKYIFAGMHLKRLGDNIQFDIFNNSNLTYFQTIDEFCYLYALIMANPYKVIILNKKTIAFKADYNDNKYCLSVNYNKLHLIDDILEKIIDIINKYNLCQEQHGGKLYDKIDKQTIKIDKKITNIKIKIISNNIMDNITIDNLIDIISRIPYDPLSHLIYKIDIDNYKKFLDPYFDEFNEIIEKLKIFATFRCMESCDIIKCFESLLFFEQFMIKYECKPTINSEIFNFIRYVFNKLNDANFKNHFDTSPQVYFDVIINHDKYNIDYSMDVDEMHKTLIDRFYYDINEEEHKYDIFVELEKNLEYIECRDKIVRNSANLHFNQNDKNGLSAHEIIKLRKRMDEIEEEMNNIMEQKIKEDNDKIKIKKETPLDAIVNECSKIFYKLVRKN